MTQRPRTWRRYSHFDPIRKGSNLRVEQTSGCWENTKYDFLISKNHGFSDRTEAVDSTVESGENSPHSKSGPDGRRL